MIYPVNKDKGRALSGVEEGRHEQLEVELEVAQEFRQGDPLRQVGDGCVSQAVELDDFVNILLKQNDCLYNNNNNYGILM